MLNNTPTYGEIQDSDGGGGDGEWCQTGPLSRYFYNLILMHLGPRQNIYKRCGGGRCLNTGINNFFVLNINIDEACKIIKRPKNKV